MTKKRKNFLTILAIVLCMVWVNLFSASMHHMEASDCMMQTTCNSCLISAGTPSPAPKAFLLVSAQVWGDDFLTQSNQVAPTPPPPKL